MQSGVFGGMGCVMSNNGISVQVSFFISLLPLVSTERVSLSYKLFLYLLENHVCLRNRFLLFCSEYPVFFSFFFYAALRAVWW